MLNVQARIRLSFGEEYGIVLDSEEGAGTCVTIIHPLLRDMAQLKKPHEKGADQDDEITHHRHLDNDESDGQDHNGSDDDDGKTLHKKTLSGTDRR